MFNRLRSLEISLAAKCQLLFGAAVVLIIGAALFVPWQRMEQLTEQINEKSAKSLAETTKAQHLLWASLPAEERAKTPMPSKLSGGATTLPVNSEGRVVAVPQLVALWTKVAKPSGFAKRSIEHFNKHLNFESYSLGFETRDGTESIHFALALRAEESCMRCHGGQVDAAKLPWITAMTQATTHAVAQPAAAGASGAQIATSSIPPAALIGLVELEMKSQVDASQLLLNRIFLLTAGLLAGTLAILVFFLITTKLILQPVRVLRETAEKVSRGDLNVRSHIFTGDEFQHLSETFNIMLANLKESEDQLRAINKSLDLKLGQLAESNVALYESNRLKSEFLANVSHELRTPLNSILGFAELLRESNGEKVDSRSARYLQNILSSGRNLLELINDLLDLAKIEAGRMEVRSAPLPLNDLFEGLTGILKPLTEKKNLVIVTGMTSDVPILQTDAAKLQQVLYNFLSNAIKFSPNGAQIHLTAEREDENRVRIAVIDKGPGIEPEKQQMIFEKFRQIDGSVTREHGGTGLGLAISKELMGLLGGTIGVRSTLGLGATFWIVLPIRIEAGAQDVRGGLVLT